MAANLKPIFKAKTCLLIIKGKQNKQKQNTTRVVGVLIKSFLTLTITKGKEFSYKIAVLDQERAKIS